MHRDLKWDNILRHTSSGQKWFMIDFDDSAQLKKDGQGQILRQAENAKDMDPDSHARELHESTHNEKVDIWSIGYLIHTSHVNLSHELVQVKNECMRDDPKKRQTALKLQRRFRELLKTSNT